MNALIKKNPEHLHVATGQTLNSKSKHELQNLDVKVEEI